MSTEEKVKTIKSLACSQPTTFESLTLNMIQQREMKAIDNATKQEIIYKGLPIYYYYCY